MGLALSCSTHTRLTSRSATLSQWLEYLDAEVCRQKEAKKF